MKTTHGAAAAAEMAAMERESKSPPTKTFKDAAAALDNAKRLLAKGEISKADFERLKKKLTAKSQSDELNGWLGKTYGGPRR